MKLGKHFTNRRIGLGEVTLNVEYAGDGPPLLLLHGYPETHLMWHGVAEALARDFQVICPDLRGYGDSDKPPSPDDHSAYSKRAMARDMVELMTELGHQRFAVAGHDRGARVCHRLCLDYPERVERACVMDIAPTLHMFRHTDQAFATGYYHWFFLIQSDGLPEHMIGQDPCYYLREKLNRWSGPNAGFNPDVMAEYERCFSDPDTIHASCEDYRAAAGIDLVHDTEDFRAGRKVECPLLVLWGEQGFVHRSYDVLAVWREYATRVEGHTLPCGHFLPEEAPGPTLDALHRFFLR
ncbi:MAG: alpha/beta hydrolase [Marinobacter sp.]|uniref:alpha/beta fold hydrolase n=1 Tax=Marinobacter sp. TaxID=50741 RepID=UPI00299CFADE|nr:alpha/beta hydrolase [Marinobacter sp.]MDX1633744.1 alpha/beta hydrolase [Marinobacter sp.]